MHETSIHRIFMITKLITAVALMTLYDEGKLALDDKVMKYIPEFEGAMVYKAETKKLEPQIEEMTIRHLLTHTSDSLWLGSKSLRRFFVLRYWQSGWDRTIDEKVKNIA